MIVLAELVHPVAIGAVPFTVIWVLLIVGILVVAAVGGVAGMAVAGVAVDVVVPHFAAAALIMSSGVAD